MATSDVQTIQKLSPLRYRIGQHGHLYLVTKRGRSWVAERDDYRDMGHAGTLHAARVLIDDDLPQASARTWRSPAGVDHLQPASGPCATCGDKHA